MINASIQNQFDLIWPINKDTEEHFKKNMGGHFRKRIASTRGMKQKQSTSVYDTCMQLWMISTGQEAPLVKQKLEQFHVNKHYTKTFLSWVSRIIHSLLFPLEIWSWLAKKKYVSTFAGIWALNLAMAQPRFGRPDVCLAPRNPNLTGIDSCCEPERA